MNKITVFILLFLILPIVTAIVWTISHTPPTRINILNPEIEEHSFEDNHYITELPMAFMYNWAHSEYWKHKIRGYRAKYNISNKWIFQAGDVYINGNGKINIAGAGQFNHNTYIEIPEGCTINIGNDVHISKNVVIYGCPYNESLFVKTGKIKTIPATTNIGNNVFIYPFNHIDGGVTIPDNTVILPFTYTRSW